MLFAHIFMTSLWSYRFVIKLVITIYYLLFFIFFFSGISILRTRIRIKGHQVISILYNEFLWPGSLTLCFHITRIHTLNTTLIAPSATFSMPMVSRLSYTFVLIFNKALLRISIFLIEYLTLPLLMV